MIRKLKLLLALACLCAACGVAPTVDEPVAATEAALTSSQVWTSPSASVPGVMTGSNYYCGGAFYYARQPMFQTVVGAPNTPSISTSPNGESSPTINYARSEFQIQCPWSPMANFPSYAINTTDMTCAYFAHTPNNWWTWSANVVVPASGLVYYPKGGAQPTTGYWSIYLKLPWDGTSGDGYPHTPGLDQWGSGYGLSACQVSHTKQITVY